MFFKTDVVRSCAVFMEKQLCWSLFLIKLQLYFNLIPKETSTKVIPVKIPKYL